MSSYFIERVAYSEAIGNAPGSVVVCVSVRLCALSRLNRLTYYLLPSQAGIVGQGQNAKKSYFYITVTWFYIRVTFKVKGQGQGHVPRSRS